MAPITKKVKFLAKVVYLQLLSHIQASAQRLELLRRKNKIYPFIEHYKTNQNGWLFIKAGMERS